MKVSRRELAAAVAIPIVLAILFFAPPIAFNLLVAAVTLAALWEFYRLAEKTGLPVAKTIGIGAGALLLLYAAEFAEGLFGFSMSLLFDSSMSSPWVPVIFALLAFAFLCSLAPLFARVEPREALGGAAATLFGVFSVALPATAMCYLRMVSPRAVLLLFLLVWGCDSAAYYFGSRFGRHKLAPRVSPKKTIEGTVAGFIAGAVIGAAAGTWWVFPELGPFRGALAGALATSAGQLGDLVESLWKRGAGVKDSGTFLPGHGGFYDRIDSLLYAGPVLAIFIGGSTPP
jgi:phosphatidate cytidylyltransferase